jgi:hypothetical protein
MTEDTKGILYYSTSPGKPVVKYPLLPGHESLRIRLLQPRPQRERIVTNNEEREWLVIVREGFSWREANGPIIEGSTQC